MNLVVFLFIMAAWRQASFQTFFPYIFFSLVEYEHWWSDKKMTVSKVISSAKVAKKNNS